MQLSSKAVGRRRTATTQLLLNWIQTSNLISWLSASVTGEFANLFKAYNNAILTHKILMWKHILLLEMRKKSPKCDAEFNSKELRVPC